VQRPLLRRPAGGKPNTEQPTGYGVVLNLRTPNTRSTAMADDHVDRVWELAKKITFCMLATRDGEDIRARPMAAYVRREESAIYFLTDARHHNDDQIRANPNLCLAFADPGDQKFVTITGRGAVSSDRAKIKELWGTAAKAWWESPDDPNIRVLSVAPKDAEYWDGPGKIIGYVKMAAAAVTGTRPDYGENKKVAM
jgi:general stress protein 26